jgi:hypothetical protein
MRVGQSETIIRKLGHLLKNVENMNDKEYRHGFQMQTNTFRQKLVPISIIENDLQVKPDDYLKSLLFLDYAVNVVFEKDRLIYNLSELQKVMPRASSYSERRIIEMPMVIMETGLAAEEVRGLLKKANVSKMKGRYERGNTTPGKSACKKPDPYYLGVATMVYDMVSDRSKAELLRVRGRNDLKALLFADTIMLYLESPSSRTKILKSLKTDFFDASIVALAELQKEASVEGLKKYLSGTGADAMSVPSVAETKPVEEKTDEDKIYEEIDREEQAASESSDGDEYP